MADTGRMLHPHLAYLAHAEFRAELLECGHVDRVKPAPTRSVVPGGFTVDDFTVDHDNRTATCPNGLTRTISRTGVATFGMASVGCPLRHRHHQCHRAQPHDASARRAAVQRPPRCPKPTVAERRSAISADGRTGHLLAGAR
jgi:hypothetical protein